MTVGTNYFFFGTGLQIAIFVFPGRLDDDPVPRNPSSFDLNKGSCFVERWDFNERPWKKGVHIQVESFERSFF